jgi:hypothetical protein
MLAKLEKEFFKYVVRMVPETSRNQYLKINLTNYLVLFKEKCETLKEIKEDLNKWRPASSSRPEASIL